MPLKTIAIITIALLFVMAFPDTTVAEDNDRAPIGTIIEIEGTAYISNTNITSNKEAKINTAIYLNDVVETGASSKALILFIDDTEITIGDNARLTIDEYIFDAKEPSENKGRFSILRGTFLFVSGLITKTQRPDVEIETPYGSIGIRGTTLWGGMLDGEYGVQVEDGEVTLNTDTGRINIGKGFGSFVKNRKSQPSQPKRWSDEKIARARKNIALKRRDIIKQRIEMRKQKHGEMRKRHREALKKRRTQIQNKLQQQNENMRNERKKQIEGQKEKMIQQRQKKMEQMRKERIDTLREQQQRTRKHRPRGTRNP